MSDDKDTRRIPLEELMMTLEQVTERASEADRDVIRNGLRQLQLRMSEYEARHEGEYAVKFDQLECARDEQRIMIQDLKTKGVLNDAQFSRLERANAKQDDSISELHLLHNRNLAELHGVMERLARQGKQQELLVELVRINHDRG